MAAAGRREDLCPLDERQRHVSQCAAYVENMQADNADATARAWDNPRYLPIGEHGLIGDLRTVALVGTNGTIDWYCCPRFDSPSVFGSILDAGKGGSFELAADVPATTKQFYFPDTNVLITRFFAEDGVGEIQDFMPIAGDRLEADRHRLIRRIFCVRGTMPFRARVAPRFDYARHPHTLHLDGSRTTFESESLSLALSASVPVEADGQDVWSRFKLAEGEHAVFALDRVGAGIAPRAGGGRSSTAPP
jgi:hypothetical protein